MATRSTIAMEFADGTVQQVYCHWDGYPEHNGKILYENYFSPYETRDLIDQGAISSLGTEVGEKHDFSRLDTEMPIDEYERMYGHMTTFYARDRGEKLQVNKFKDYADYVANFVHEEYAYILRTNGIWYVKSYKGDFEPLHRVLDAVLADQVDQ